MAKWTVDNTSQIVELSFSAGRALIPARELVELVANIPIIAHPWTYEEESDDNGMMARNRAFHGDICLGAAWGATRGARWTVYTGEFLCGRADTLDEAMAEVDRILGQRGVLLLKDP